VSEAPSSGPSGLSESQLRALRKFAKEQPWVPTLLVNPGLLGARPQGNDGADDTPPAGAMTRDERPVSPPLPAAPLANHDLSTSERTIEDPSTTQLPPSTPIMAPTQPPVSVTPPACGTSIQSPGQATETTASPPERRRSGRRRPVGK